MGNHLHPLASRRLRMNDQERYLFDLNGYLVVPDALSREQVARLNGVLDEHIAAECPPDMRTHRFGPVLEWAKEYRDLIDNPGITPYVSELLGDGFRLDHVYLDVIRSGKGPIGTRLHGGAIPFNPTHYFRFEGRPDAQRPLGGGLQPEGRGTVRRRFWLCAGLAQEQLFDSRMSGRRWRSQVRWSSGSRVLPGLRSFSRRR